MSLAAPELSVLLPAFNEAESLPQLWSELGPVLDALGRGHAHRRGPSRTIR